MKISLIGNKQRKWIKEDLWNYELKRRGKLLQKHKNGIIKEDWFNVLLNTKGYSRKKEDNFKIQHELTQFFNNHNSLNKHRRYIYIMRLIPEINFDLKSSRLLAFAGFYKQANGSLRSALENAFRIIYFKQHPKSLAKLNEDKYYSLKRENINQTKFKNKKINKKIENKQKELSKSIHTSPKNLTPNLFGKPSFKKEKYAKWLKEFNQVKKLILEMVL